MRLTLPRLLVTALWMFCGALLALEFHRSLGASGYIVGFVVGFAGSFLLTWGVLLGRILLLFPFPICRQGKCRGLGAFVWKRGTIYGWEGEGSYRYKCKCGDQYIRRGGQFIQVLPGGKEQPYKKLVSFRTWADEVARP